MQKIILIIESASDDLLWGRVNFDDNLIVESAPDEDALKKKMARLLKDFNGLHPKEIEFDVQYDITWIFEEKRFLNVSEIAKRAGINKSLMLQYTSGKKLPSLERVLAIQKVIQQMGRELLEIKIAAPFKQERKIKSLT